MTSPVAVIGLAWDDFDLQRADLDIHFEITEGMDELPTTRGSDQVIPFRRGQLPSPRMAHSRPVVATGWVAGPPTASAKTAYRAYVDSLKARLDPTSLPRVLVATLEDGSKRWILAVPRNLIGGPGLGSDFRPFSIEWEALDPYWYGAWGTLALDTGYLLDSDLALDGSAEIAVTPSTGAHALQIDTLGSAEVERLRITLTGPSVAAVGFQAALATGEVVGFTYPALAAGQSLVVDNHERLVELSGVNRRDLLTLRADNLHGEYARLSPGINDVRIFGQPTTARIRFTPTYL